MPVKAEMGGCEGKRLDSSSRQDQIACLYRRVVSIVQVPGRTRFTQKFQNGFDSGSSGSRIVGSNV